MTYVILFHWYFQAHHQWSNRGWVTFHYEELLGQNEWIAAIKVKHSELSLSEVYLATISKAVISHFSKTSNSSFQTEDDSIRGGGGVNQGIMPLVEKLISKKYANCNQDKCNYNRCPWKTKKNITSFTTATPLTNIASTLPIFWLPCHFCWYYLSYWYCASFWYMWPW